MRLDLLCKQINLTEDLWKKMGVIIGKKFHVSMEAIAYPCRTFLPFGKLAFAVLPVVNVPNFPRTF